jgi:transposase
MDTEPFKRFREERLVFHGLRKNAVIALLEVGCTEAEVGAIVNMSEQMVRHYGREVSLKALARNGMKLLESRWKDVRPVALEQEQNANWKPSVRIGNRWTRDTLASARKDK